MKPPSNAKPTSKKPVPPRGPDKRPRASRQHVFFELDKNGEFVKYRSAYEAGRAMLNSPMVSVALKVKLIGALTPYEKPRLAQKEVGLKEARNTAAKTAGRHSEFDGLMEPPTGPRLVVNNNDAPKPPRKPRGT